MTARIRIIELANRGDARGFSFTAPSEALACAGRMADVHFAATKPEAVPGNHYHLRRREAIVILPGTKWSLHWDEGEGSSVQRRGRSRGHPVYVAGESQHSMSSRFFAIRTTSAWA